MICPLAWRGGCQLRLIHPGRPSTATAVKSRGAVVGADVKQGSLLDYSSMSVITRIQRECLTSADPETDIKSLKHDDSSTV